VFEANGIADLVEDFLALWRLGSGFWHVDLARVEGI
jgi:hypothetical protein